MTLFSLEYELLIVNFTLIKWLRNRCTTMENAEICIIIIYTIKNVVVFGYGARDLNRTRIPWPLLSAEAGLVGTLLPYP